MTDKTAETPDPIARLRAHNDALQDSLTIARRQAKTAQDAAETLYYERESARDEARRTDAALAQVQRDAERAEARAAEAEARAAAAEAALQKATEEIEYQTKKFHEAKQNHRNTARRMQEQIDNWRMFFQTTSKALDAIADNLDATEATATRLHNEAKQHAHTPADTQSN